MCGIVGYVGNQVAQNFLLEGLRRLEYRGYDSAGTATLDEKQQLHIVKAVGRIASLATELDKSPSDSPIGIGHTRCLLYTSPSPRDLSTSRMPSSA